MTIAPTTIDALNSDFARIPLQDDRKEPVRIEVEQLASAIETVRSGLAFDAEPAGFRAVLAGISREPRS